MVLNVSESIGDSALVLFSKKGANISYSSMEDLKPYTIGGLRGNAHTDEFDTVSYLKKDFVDSMDINIKKLLKGRIDLIVGSRMATQEIINTNFPQDVDKFDIVEPPLNINTLHVSFSKKLENGEKILQDFNNGLKMIQDDESLKTILESHGFK